MNEEIKKLKSDNSSSTDEELDVTSDKFNPLKALYSDKIKSQLKNVKKFDNLAQFMSRLKKNAGNQIESNLCDVPKPSTSKSSAPKEESEEDLTKFHITTAGRKFLKEQAPVTKGKKAKYKRDLLIRMENAIGPMSLMQKFRTNRTKVKVYVRKEHGIRGYVIGFIEAFDKHYNLAMSECVETWKRRKFKFSEAKIVHSNPAEDCSKFLKEMKIDVPEITVKSLNRKYVECTREMGQLMIRGEDVVLVSEFKLIES